MKRSKVFLLLIGLFLLVFAQGQDNISNRLNDEGVAKHDKEILELNDSIRVVVNIEMIRRFNNCEPEEEVLTFYNIFRDYSFEVVQYAFSAYYYDLPLDSKAGNEFADK